MWKGRSPSYKVYVYKFSCINVYKMPDDGSHLDPKHVVVTILIKLSAACDWFNTYTRTYIFLRMAAEERSFGLYYCVNLWQDILQLAA